MRDCELCDDNEVYETRTMYCHDTETLAERPVCDECLDIMEV